MLTERFEGLTRLRVMSVANDEAHELALPDPVYTVWVGANEEYGSRTLRYGYTSLVAPATDVDYDMDTRAATVVKVQPVHDYDASAYTSARMWVDQPDGARVPVSIVHRKDVPLDGTAPALLYGYGSYEISIDAGFRVFAAVAARPWVRVRDRARARRWRARPRLVRSRSARAEAQHVHRFHRLRRGVDRARATPRPRDSSRAAGAPAAC